jgi:methylated-DNA-[protein]-cysteine S-methyltransferase
MTLLSTRIPSPVGPLLLVADDTHLRGLWFDKPRHPPRCIEWVEGDNKILHEARVQLDAYFAGERRAFDLPLRPIGTDFQREVWTMLTRIPYGETWSYGDMARRIGKPDAVRAVGAANGRNPISIVVPCHRVIGSDGSLTGFGGGLPTKQFLLALEGALPAGKDLFAAP